MYTGTLQYLVRYMQYNNLVASVCCICYFLIVQSTFTFTMSSVIGCVGVWACTGQYVRPGMHFGPPNFPAVIDRPMKCRWFVLGPAGKMAIEFLFADIANNDCESATSNCLAVVQNHGREEINRSSQIQKVSVKRSSAMVVMYINEVSSGFRGFHARFVEE